MLLLLTVALSLVGQVFSTWNVTYTKLTNTAASKSTSFTATSIFSNGDVLASGSTEGLVGYAMPGNNFFFQRYTSGGTLIWTRVLGSSGSNDALFDTKIDSNDNVYACGSTLGRFDGQTSQGSMDAVIVKLDSAGNKIYSKQVGGPGNDWCHSVAIDESRNVIYASGGTYNGGNNGFVNTIDATSGDVIRETKRGAGVIDFSGVAVDSVGNLWATGYLYVSSEQGQDWVVEKFTPEGATLFRTTIGAAVSADKAEAIAVDSSDNVYITGTASGTINGQSSGDWEGALVVKLNSTGATQWTKFTRGAGQDIAVDSATGRVFFAGSVGYPYMAAVFTVLSTMDGALRSQEFAATGSEAYAFGNAVASRGPFTYFAGFAKGRFQAQTSPAYKFGFVMRLNDTTGAAPTAAPTAAPSTTTNWPHFSASPTSVPTDTPVCVQWALGDYGETCSATCGKLSRTCKDKYFKTVLTQDAFYAVVGSAVNVRSGAAVGTAGSFCSQTTSSNTSVGALAALSIVLATEDGREPVRTSCSFPTSTAKASVGCDAALPLDDYRRFCPCVDYDCDGSWYLGFSGDTCTTTCNKAGGACDAAPVTAITDSVAFSAMVATATVLGTDGVIGETAATFCNRGINLLPFAAAPAAITLHHGGLNRTLCTFPTDAQALHGGCDVAFTDLPAQRFCNCKFTV